VRTVHRLGEQSGDEESFTAVFAFGTSRQPDKTIIAICRFTSARVAASPRLPVNPSLSIGHQYQSSIIDLPVNLTGLSAVGQGVFQSTIL
jgi:hypothetical protein